MFVAVEAALLGEVGAHRREERIHQFERDATFAGGAGERVDDQVAAVAGVHGPVRLRHEPRERGLLLTKG